MTTTERYTPRKEPVQARSRATYNAILDAAAQVLAEQGYPATTTNKIAERAGASIGTVYEYFPSKEAVFAALIKRLDQHTAKTVFKNFECIERLTPAEFLESVLRSRIEAALEFPELESLLRSEIPDSLFTEQAENTLQQFSHGMRAFANTYPEVIRVKDLETAIEFGTIAVESIVRAITGANAEKLTDQALVQEFVDMMTRYILKN